MTATEINRKFAELAGIPSRFAPFTYPDFCADPRLVLEVMMRREDWQKFGKLYLMFASFTTEDPLEENYNFAISTKEMMDTTGLLALKGIEWMEKNNASI
jgi:hypothetical protein